MTAPPAAHLIAQLKANHVAANAVGLGSPALDAWYETITDIVTDSPDPEATIGAIAQLISRERRKELACQLYRDCTETGPHFDHFRHNLKVVGSDEYPVLEAGMVALSGGDMQPIVYIHNEEFADAVSVRAKTSELRNLLDQVDEMADRVFADHQGRS
ncbi:hypothetical protein [Streptomyces sp. IB201691-2A2]|uniref:hypothetical protein n=1 Tax=Streptomyces sp. IB201691-2A2 TaxID=2561920 RepID=UPI0011807D10|nr:hypothetical protein [Streptomyces sp. IB201691-2A2]TRO55897.1 hypothetical protein E4K73_48820 [Streptomyces sp. IB201691-2A2]